jgi:anti-sigma28 factor (negative regulator of flagellin synthesis)
MSSTGGPEPVRAGLVDNVRSQIAQGTFEQNVDMEKVVDGIMADL